MTCPICRIRSTPRPVHLQGQPPGVRLGCGHFFWAAAKEGA